MSSEAYVMNAVGQSMAVKQCIEVELRLVGE